MFDHTDVKFQFLQTQYLTIPPEMEDEIAEALTKLGLVGKLNFRYGSDMTLPFTKSHDPVEVYMEWYWRCPKCKIENHQDFKPVDDVECINCGWQFDNLEVHDDEWE